MCTIGHYVKLVNCAHDTINAISNVSIIFISTVNKVCHLPMGSKLLNQAVYIHCILHIMFSVDDICVLGKMYKLK